jgi:hypothetical protein
LKEITLTYSKIKDNYQEKMKEMVLPIISTKNLVQEAKRRSLISISIIVVETDIKIKKEKGQMIQVVEEARIANNQTKSIKKRIKMKMKKKKR